MFRSAALKEAGYPIGTPLNRYAREWKPFPPPRWMLRRDLAAQGFDTLLPRGTGRCWCSHCGAYFGSVSTFEGHFEGDRCLSFTQMRRKGWFQSETGHWVKPWSANS